MAKIVLNDLAPSDVAHISLASSVLEEFPYETEDRELLSNAVAHPWLAVEAEESDAVAADPLARSVAPADDALSAQNSVANDPDAVRAELDRRREDADLPLAVESGLDQGEPRTVGADDNRVAVTLAADATEDRE